MRVLVSTSDKSGLIGFLKALTPVGLEIVSTGGTCEYLRQNGFAVTEVSQLTQFPEVLDGRVKTLHPAVHMGLLADQSNPQHLSQLKEHGVQPFDMVIGNLYPFEDAARLKSSSLEELIEKIDIGGPSFLRASAKNFKSVTVVCSPEDYDWVQKKINEKNMQLQDRRRLAMKVFSLTSYYDALIVERMCEEKDELHYLNLPLKKKNSLRYGENPQQQAEWYYNPLQSEMLQSAQIHQGKELSYNNILDLDAAVELVRRLEQPGCVAVKHNNPCGAATAPDLASAAVKTLESDPKSIFGGILAFNREVDLSTCQVFREIFLECIVAPSFTQESLEYLAAKKNLRVLSWPDLQKTTVQQSSYRSISGGLLRQSADTFSSSEWTFMAEPPTAQLQADMLFGESVAASLKSNAIAIVGHGQTLGLGMGQVNRVDAVRQALERLADCEKRVSLKRSEMVLISDAFFPFPDSVETIAEAGIRWVLQPGGSVQDEKVLAAAKQNGINMVMSKRRHFKH